LHEPGWPEVESHFATDDEVLGHPETLTLRADTRRHVALDVGESLVHHGFRRAIPTARPA
jgi:creatinine amidohydrolase/Fe(II)-dependent formamide hydrolase-like protein